MKNTQIKLIRIKEVIRQTGVSKSYLYQLRAKGLFPQTVPLVPGGKAVAWVESEVQDWIQSRIAERDNQTK